MAKANSTLTWTEIDPASLPEAVQTKYAEYKAGYAEMKRRRQAFEEMLQAGAPAGKRIVCGYNFGKLSLALADGEPVKAKQAKGSLAEFLAGQANAGRRA